MIGGIQLQCCLVTDSTTLRTIKSGRTKTDLHVLPKLVFVLLGVVLVRRKCVLKHYSILHLLQGILYYKQRGIWFQRAF